MFQPRRGSLDAHLFENRPIGSPPTLFYRIEIPVEPFIFDRKTQRTSVRMDFIEFPCLRGGNCGPRVPISRESGGRVYRRSIYLGHAHNTADTTRIAFGDLNANILTASFDITFDFTLEDGTSEVGVFSISWQIELECDPLSLDALVKEADRTAARGESRNPPLERTAAAVYFICGRASRLCRRGRSTARRYPTHGLANRDA